jgi:tetratricopeptide (TPR) repeat protein
MVFSADFSAAAFDPLRESKKRLFQGGTFPEPCPQRRKTEDSEQATSIFQSAVGDKAAAVYAEPFTNLANPFANIHFPSGVSSPSSCESSHPVTLLKAICEQQEKILHILGKQEKHSQKLEQQFNELKDVSRSSTSRGFEALREERYEEAVLEFSDSISRNPKDSYSVTKRGETYLKLSKKELALQDFLEALRIDPKNSLAQLRLSELFYSREDFAPALEILHELIERESENVEALVLRGKISRQTGSFHNSLQDLEEALRFEPQNTLAKLEHEETLKEHMGNLRYYS